MTVWVVILTVKLISISLAVRQVNAPYKGCVEKDKLDFDSDLKKHVEKVNILMWDFNAWMGSKSEEYKNVLGCFGYDIRNDYRMNLLDFY